MRGRPVLGGVAGLFFGAFVAYDLFLAKVIVSDSPLVVALPVVFLVLGVVVGLRPWSRRGR